MARSSNDFRATLQEIFRLADALGLVGVEVSSGNLHRRVGDYPGPNHRMPTCCDVMRKEMTAGDSIVSEPESGAGATVVIRYSLPRTT